MMATDVDSIQSDSKLLEDFPVFDTSLDDDPNFRRQLNKWSLKTEKVKPIRCVTGLNILIGTVVVI